MTLEITPLYAAILAVMLFWLWLGVVKRRGATDISIGFDQDTTLHENIRKHGNFIEIVPMALLIMAFAELRGANGTLLHLVGAILVFSRALHPFGLHHGKTLHVARLIGNSGSLLALFIAAGAIVWSYF